ncbi:MAG: glycosyltransferase family 2 protein [Deltaproteobacteria bacterium]|nr:glycosyltransferase family 2 protein [Deltaproteobacteria bacterium]
MDFVTVAVCTYNRAGRLPELINALRQQECQFPFEILVVDNNSTDNTQDVLRQLAHIDGPPLRFVSEMRQGIVHARNRCIEETRNSAFLAFIDDDELPGHSYLKVAVDALKNEGAECVGGEIRVKLPNDPGPPWLTDELLGFLGKVKHSKEAFWISERSTPVWSGNVAYKTALFRDGLRFDERYNRAGKRIGGGSDAIMFWKLLESKRRIRYRPDMWIEHLIDPEKIRCRYFLKLHFSRGRKFGQYETRNYSHTLIGVPPFMVRQTLQHLVKTIRMIVFRQPGMVRQAMNSAYAVGSIWGRLLRRQYCE